jgi:hypothetical protein
MPRSAHAGPSKPPSLNEPDFTDEKDQRPPGSVDVIPGKPKQPKTPPDFSAPEPPPLVHPDATPEERLQFAIQRVNKRLARFDIRSIEKEPNLAAQLAASGMPDDMVERIGRDIHFVQEFVDNRDQLAGIPGALTQVRQRALNFSDPGIRAAALGLTEALQRLPKEQQQVAWMILTGQGDKLTDTMLAQGQATLEQLVPGLDVQGFEGIEGAPQELLNRRAQLLTLQGETASIDKKAALLSLFPNLRGFVDIIDQDTDASGAAWLLQEPLVAGAVQPWFDLYDHPTLTQLFSLPFKEALHTAAAPFTLGLRGVEKGAQLASATDLPVVGQLGKLADAGVDLANIAFEKVAAMTDPIADYVAGKVGFKGKDRESVKGLISGALQFYLFHKTFKTLSRIKAVRTLPEDVYNAQYGIGKPLGADARAFLGSEALGAAIKSARNLPDLLLDKPIEVALGKLFGKGWDEWITSKAGRTYFDDMAKAKDQTAAGLRARYGRYGITPELAEKLAATPVEGRPAAFLEHVNKGAIDAEFVRAQANLTAVDDKITQGESILSRIDLKAIAARIRGTEPDKTPIPEGAQRLYHVTKARFADSIKERGLIENAKTQFGDRAAVNGTPSGAEAYRQITEGRIAEGDVVVEYWATPEQIIGRGTSGDLLGRGETAGTSTTVGSRSIPPDQIIAVHSPRAALLKSADVVDAMKTFDTVQSVRKQILRLQAARASLQNQLAVGYKPPARPMFTFPKRSIIRAGIQNPATPLEHLVNNMARSMYAITRGTFDVRKFVDEMPRTPTFVNQFGEGASVDAREVNLDTIATWNQRLRLPKNVARGVENRFLKVKDEVGLNEFLEEWNATINLHLPANTPFEIREALTKWHEHPIYDKPPVVTTEVRTGEYGNRSKSEPIAEYTDEFGGVHRIADRPSMTMGWKMPDINYVLDATSMLRRFFRSVHDHGLAGRASADALYYAPRWILRSATGALKGPILGLRWPAVLQRTQFEQFFRNMSAGMHGLVVAPEGYTIFSGGIPIPFTGIRILKARFEKGIEILGEDPRYVEATRPGSTAGPDLGTIMSVMDDLDSRHEWTEVETVGMRTFPKTVVRGGMEQIRAAADDWMLRDIAAGSSGVPTSARFTKWWNDTGLPNMRRASWAKGMADADILQEWFTRESRHLEQITGNNPDLIEAIATGRWYERGRKPIQWTDSAGRNVSDRWNTLDAERVEIQGRLRKAVKTAETDVVRAMQGRLRKVMREQRALEEIAPEVRTMGTRGYTDITHSREFARRLKREWEAGTTEAPPSIQVPRRRSNYIKDEGLAEGVQEMLNDWSAAWYSTFKPVSALDLKLTRGSAYYQLFDRYNQVLLKRGWAPEEAKVWAETEAAVQVRDLMYDLSQRTSMQQAFKDVFWFGPATQEILYTWFVKIPSRAYLLPGLLLEAGQAHAMMQMLKSAGIVQHDARTGEDIVTVPGLSSFISAITGKKVPDIAFFKTKGVNLVASSPFPSLSTVPSWAVGKAAEQWGGAFKSLADIAAPYGTQVTGTPQPVIFLWEAITGNPFPIEALSPGRVKADYDRAFDMALQLQYRDMQKAGDVPPKPEDFFDTTDPATGRPALSDAAQKKYDKAVVSYTRTLMAGAKDQLQGTMWGRFLGSTISPVSLNFSDSERREWEDFWENTVLPAGVEGAEFNEKQRILIDRYLQEHPSSFAFNVFYSRYDDKQRDLPWKSTGEDAYFDLYLTGEKRVLTPEEFARKLQSVSSYQHYVAELNQALSGISPTLNWKTLLTSGYKRQQAIADYQEKWDRWQALNPLAAGEMEDSRNAWNQYHDKPTRSFEVERLATTISYLNQLTGFFTGESGLRETEFRAIMTEMKLLYADTGQFGPPTTKNEKALDKWWTEVGTPYFEALEPLQRKANTLSEASVDASDIYEKMRLIKAKYAAAAAKAGVPSPEAMTFGNRSKPEQESALLNWATKPPSWLTPFQQKKLGYKSFEGDDEFYSAINKSESEFRQFLDDHADSITPGSLKYDWYQKWHDQDQLRIAKGFGDAAVRQLQLQNAAPYVRLEQTGFGKGNKSWEQVTAWVEDITATLRRKDLSERGFSDLAEFYKVWLYGQISDLRDKDHQFDRMLTDLGFSIPARGYTQKTGAPLYEAIFFNNWTDDFIPNKVTEVAA